MIGGFFEVALLLSAPLVLAAAGELLLERSGTLQIGLEGTMLLGAFAAFAIGLKGAGPGAALAAATAVGTTSGLLFAFFAVERRADPILVGTAWNLLALGATGFAYRLVAGETGRVLEVPTLGKPWLGLPIPVVLSFGVPVLLHVFFRGTRAGLIVTAAGETPAAVRALGRSVVGVRTATSAVAGLLGGAAGGLLVVTVSPTFVEGVTAGRGFLALSLVVFARWKPLGLIPAALLLGGGTALQYRLQAGGGSSIPYPFFLALPALLALAGLAFSSSRGGAPKALGSPAP